MADKQNPYDTLWSMIDKSRFAMFTTIEPDGSLRSRPMTTVQNHFDGSLWFFAKADTDVVRAVAANPRVSLSYGDSKNADFVALSGSATVVTDVAKKRELWTPAVEAWLPQGPDSSSVVLLDVEADHGEYWDSASKLVQLFSVARALATAEKPPGQGEHRKLAI
jgi:general stress protein 26